MSKLFEAIEKKYGIAIPFEYREMYRRGWLADRDTNTMDREWLPLEEILDYDFPEYALPGFVPFCQDGTGDTYCWYPVAAHLDGIPVAFCLSGDDASLYAPNFLAFVYRNVLTYASGMFAEGDVEEGRNELRRWSSTVCTLMPQEWQDTVKWVIAQPFGYSSYKRPNDSYGLITQSQYLEILKRDLAYQRLDEEVPWAMEWNGREFVLPQ